MKFAHRNVRAAFNPLYPDAWRGHNQVVLIAGGYAYRASWAYRKNQGNDCERVDGYNKINISPRWFRQFQFCTYPGIQHLTFGQLTFSRIRTRNFGDNPAHYL